MDKRDAPGTRTVDYVIEHRSALNGSRVTVGGMVVWTLLGDDACASGAGMCAQPRISIASTGVASRDPAYDLMVLLPAGTGAAFRVGQWVEVSGRVDGGPSGVMISTD